MGRPYLGGSFNVWQNVTDGGEGVKKIEKSVDIVYGQPLRVGFSLSALLICASTKTIKTRSVEN